MCAALRCLPWVKKVLTPEDRYVIAMLPLDLKVYLGPTSPRWQGRTWRCMLTRGEETLADTAGHPDPATALDEAVGEMERRRAVGELMARW